MLKRLRERTTPTDVVMWFIGAAILACSDLGLRGHSIRRKVLLLPLV